MKHALTLLLLTAMLNSYSQNTSNVPPIPEGFVKVKNVGIEYALDAEEIVKSDTPTEPELRSALIYFDLAEENGFVDAYMLYLKGRCLNMIDEHAKAVATFTKCIELLGEDPGWKFVRNGPMDKEHMNVPVSIPFDAFPCYAFIMRGDCKRLLGDNAGAEKDVNRAFTICPDRIEGGWPSVYLVRGMARIEQKWPDKIEKGCDDLRRAGELGVEDAYIYIRQNCR